MNEALNRSALARDMVAKGDDREEIIAALQRTGSSRDSAMSLVSLAQRKIFGRSKEQERGSGRRRTKGSVPRDKLKLNLTTDTLQRLDAESAARGTYSGTLAATLIEIICENSMFDAVLDGDLPKKVAP